MQTNICSTLLLLFVALATNSATASSSYEPEWILQKPLATVNLYKALFEYLGAILSQGIPPLDVQPIDPYSSNATFEIQLPYSPVNPNFTNVDVVSTGGLNVSGFSEFNVATADLNLDNMSSSLELDLDYGYAVLFDVNTSALYLDGSVKQYNCSKVYITVEDSVFTSNKQLELQGEQLHVKTFQLGYEWVIMTTKIYWADCQGDFELVYTMLNTVLDALINIADIKIPAAFNSLSSASTIVLNDIFALRNVTDDGSSKTKPDTTNRFLESELRGEAVKHTTTRESYLKSAKQQQNKEDIQIKWTL